MGKRQKEWARKKRDELYALLGGQCVLCHATENLEFDCIFPSESDAHHRQLSWDQRISFYFREHKKRNIQLLCNKCHGKKTRKESRQAFLLFGSVDEPF